MPPISKKKVRLDSITLGLIIGVIATFALLYFYKLFSTPDSTYAAKSDSYNQWYTTCVLDPNSTDRIPPTINMTSPKDGTIVQKGDVVYVYYIPSDNQPLQPSIGTINTRAWLLVNDNLRDLSVNFGPITNDTQASMIFGINKPYSANTFKVQVKMCDAAGNMGASNVVTLHQK